MIDSSLPREVESLSTFFDYNETFLSGYVVPMVMFCQLYYKVVYKGPISSSIILYKTKDK